MFRRAFPISYYVSIMESGIATLNSNLWKCIKTNILHILNCWQRHISVGINRKLVYQWIHYVIQHVLRECMMQWHKRSQYTGGEIKRVCWRAGLESPVKIVIKACIMDCLTERCGYTPPPKKRRKNRSRKSGLRSLVIIYFLLLMDELFCSRFIS